MLLEPHSESELLTVRTPFGIRNVRTVHIINRNPNVHTIKIIKEELYAYGFVCVCVSHDSINK